MVTGASGFAGALLWSGVEVMGCALMLNAVTFVFVPLARGRPRRGGRVARRTAARVESLATALDRVDRRLPAAQVSIALACRDRLARRAVLAVAPGFLVTNVGFIGAAVGLLWGSAPWHGTSDEWVGFRLLGLIAGYLVLFGMSLLVQKQIYNWNADYFAAYCLLRAIELVVELERVWATPELAGVDQVNIRRELSGQLRGAADYVRRLVGKVLPLLAGRDELRAVTERAAQVAAGIQGWQVLVVSGSPDEIVGLLPTLGDILAALVQHRFRDLPRVAMTGPDSPMTGEPSAETSPDVERPNVEKLSDDDRYRLAVALAECYHQVADAGIVLDAIGFSRGRWPIWQGGNAETWWNEVLIVFDQGILVDPYRRLLGIVLDRHPHNEVFLAMARDYGKMAPARQVSHSSASGIRRVAQGVTQWIRG